MEAVKTIDWNRYGLKDWEGMPVSIFINFVSVYVPYTGAGKLAISAEDEIVEEIRNALMECAREISHYLNALEHARLQEHRRSIFFRYLSEVAQALEEITGNSRALLAEKLKKIAEVRTDILLREGEGADEKLEEVGQVEEDVGENGKRE